MITVVCVDNPLRPTERHVKRLSAPACLGDWIAERWPGGVPPTLKVVVNGTEIPPDRCARLMLQDDDHALIVATPAGIETIAYYIAQAVIMAAISGVVSSIFAPKKPAALVDQPQASPVYSISGSQNAARLGEPIPVGYGSFLQVPDFGSQPYVEFVDNEQFLNELLVIGQGEYLVSDMMVGETPVSSLPDGIVLYERFTGARHTQRMGVIEDTATIVTGFLENVTTAPEVGDQELSSGAPILTPPTMYWRSTSIDYNVPPGTPNYPFLPGSDGTDPGYDLAWLKAHGTETPGTPYTYCYFRTTDGTGGFIYTYVDIVGTTYGPPPYPPRTVMPDYTVTTPAPGSTIVGYFDCCKAGHAPEQTGDKIMLDFVFPGGLYHANTTTGELEGATVVVEVDYQAIDVATGAPLAAPITASFSWTEGTNTPVRTTEVIDLTAAPGRYRVRCRRITPNSQNLNTGDKIVWAGLKFKMVRAPSDRITYGNVMVVAVRIKATNGIAAAATSRVRFRVQRILSRLGIGPLLPTNNPADTYVDILTAPYGAARPISEIDMPALTAVRRSWAGPPAHSGFNAVFAQRSTVFEALSMCLQVVAAGPLPIGGLMSVEVDTVKDSRVAMFGEANLTNLVVNYEFDKDGAPPGVRVEYRRPDSFTPDFVVLPENETDVEAISLFGCSDEDTAAQYAQLVLNRRALQRKSVSFDTEQEGLMLLPGDRIAVQHQMPRWGQVGIVDEVQSGTVVIPDTSTLLMHADGADGSTLILDASSVAAPLTPAGNAQIDTAQSVFGGASLLLDGAGDYVDTPAHARYDVGLVSATTDHTWRFRARFVATAGRQVLLAHGTPREPGVGLGGFAVYDDGGKLGLMLSANTYAPPSGDAYWANVVALLHFEGADASTTCVDSAATPNTFSALGNAQLDNAQKKFGATSALFDGTGDVFKCPDRAALRPGAQEFTLELWVRFNVGTFNIIIATKSNTTGAYPYQLWCNAAGKFGFQGITNGGGSSFSLLSTTTATAGVWYHLAGVRQNSSPNATFRFYVNGVQESNSNLPIATVLTADTGPFALGAYEHGVACMNGWIDEVRLTIGACRYPNGATFAVPTAAFPEGAYTVPPFWAAWETSAAVIAAAAQWYALAVELDNGVPRIFVDGVEKPGAWVVDTGAQATMIGLDTTRADYGLRIGAPFPPGGDVLFSLVKFGANFTGANGATSFTDYAGARPISAAGDAQASTAQSTFGAGSSLLLDGTGDYLAMPDSADWAPGVGVDFCWEFVVRPNGTFAGNTDLLSQALGSGNYPVRIYRLSGANGGVGVLGVNAAGTLIANFFGGSLVDNAWSHIALTREGVTWRIYVNGVQVNSSVPGNAALFDAPDTLKIGAFNPGGAGNNWKGNIQSARYTLGNARYLSGTTFAPPVALFPTFAGSAPFNGWLDELNVRPDVAYTANYAPETAPFTGTTTSGGSAPILVLDRGLDWDATPPPFAVMLSSELNGVSLGLACDRGDADHIVQLIDPAPFDLFGKGAHQEPTRVAFGTLDNIVRDWIVVEASPTQGLGVHVEALTYNPDVYIGAMPHQLTEPALDMWFGAGTPAAPATEWIIGGTPAAPSAGRVIAGTPDNPSG